MNDLPMGRPLSEVPRALGAGPLAGFPLAERDRWRAQGWLRPLDVAFSDFLLTLQPRMPESLLAAAVLLTHLESRGHSNLPLEPVVSTAPGDPGEPGAGGADDPSLDARALLLGWPPEGTCAASALLRERLGEASTCRRDWAAGDPHGALLQIDPADDVGTSPLVLDGERLYLRRYWRHERRIAAAVRDRVLRPAGSTGAHPPAGAARWLQALFPRTPDGPSAADARTTEPDWQAVACALALKGGLTVITGGPGTGKTYTAARLLVLLQALQTRGASEGEASGRSGASHGADAAAPPPLRVALAAPTGKAAARLKQSIDRALQDLSGSLDARQREDLGLARLASALPAAQTLHRLLGARPGTRRMARGADRPLEVDLLIVDEASMIHLEMMDALLAALPRTARLVLLGDRDQLASVEAGAVMGDLCATADRPEASASGPDAAAQPAAPAPYDADTRDWIARCTGTVLPEPLRPGPPLAQATVVLRRSRRFSGPIGRLALAVNAGDRAAAEAVFAEGATAKDADRAAAVARTITHDPQQVARLAVDGRPGVAGCYRDYLALLTQGPSAPDAGAQADWVLAVLRAFDRMRVLCALREGPWGAAGLNLAIESALADAGLLPGRRDEWYLGRPVLVTRNDPSLGIFNGDIGIVLGAPGTARIHDSAVADSPIDSHRHSRAGNRRAWFEGPDGLRSVSVNRLADVQTAYAMTVHKSQGSEFDHVVLALPEDDSPVLTRELAYTGITRSRSACTVVCGHAAALERALARRTRRLSGLADRLIQGH